MAKAAEWTPERVLALEIEDSDSGAKTVRDFLKALAGGVTAGAASAAGGPGSATS